MSNVKAVVINGKEEIMTNLDPMSIISNNNTGMKKHKYSNSLSIIRRIK